MTLGDLKKYSIPIIFGAFVLLVGGYSYVADYLPVQQTAAQKDSQLASLLAASEEFTLGERTQLADCQAQGSLPDPECTPGQVFADATKEIICVSGYSQTVRDVSVSLKKKVFAQYGISYPVPFGSYEIDHLIPLSLGGSNSIANLWPKAAEPFPGFYEKNITGNYLKEQVCEGNISLVAAQKQMAKDWFSAFSNLGDDTIKELKSRYNNWAERK